MAAQNETVLRKLMQGLANGHPRNVVRRGENVFGGKAIPGGQFPLKDLLADLFGDLKVGWDASRTVNHETPCHFVL
jgi:hypothetical protein